MPPAITHDEGFEIALSHQAEQLTIYDSMIVSNNSQGEAANATAHVGDFSGVLSRAMVRRKTNGEQFQMRLLILQKFDFLSANAVRFGLRIVSAKSGKKEILLDPILKTTHVIKRRSPTGIHWFDVESSEASHGTVSVSVTRGSTDPETDVFVPLSGKEGVPYAVEIERRQDDTKRRAARGIQHSPATPAASSKRPGKASKPKASRTTEQAGGSSNADESTELTEAEIATEQVAPKQHDKINEANVEPNANGQEQALGAADPTQEKPLPLRFKDVNNEADPAQPGDASNSIGAEMFPTPPTTFVQSDRKPKPDPNVQVTANGSVVSSTPAPAHETSRIETLNRKRNIDEAFGSGHLHEGKKIKQLQLKLRKAAAVLDAANTKWELVASQAGEDSIAYTQILLTKAKGVHGVWKLSLR
jgi:hypothetical protein